MTEQSMHPGHPGDFPSVIPNGLEIMPDEDRIAYDLGEPPSDFHDTETDSQTETPNPEAALETVTLIERLQIIKQELGFYPVNRGEANEAFGLMGDNSSSPVARHLFEILRHQEKADTNNPMRALGSVISEYGSYASRANYDASQLIEMRKKLFEPDRVNMRQSLADFGVIDGATQLARYLDTLDIIETGDVATHGFDGMTLTSDGKRQAYDVYTGALQPPTVRKRIQHRLETVTVGQARRGVDYLITEQNTRRAFWREVLEQATRYPRTRRMAQTALKNS